MGCGVLMDGWVGGGWVSNDSEWVCGMRLGCVFCFSVVGVVGFFILYFYILLVLLMLF